MRNLPHNQHYISTPFIGLIAVKLELSAPDPGKEAKIKVTGSSLDSVLIKDESVKTELVEDSD